MLRFRGYRQNSLEVQALTLMQLMANLTNAKWGKKLKKLLKP